MDPIRNISVTQITWIVGTLLGLAMAVFMGSAVGSQDFQKVIMVLGAGMGIATFLILGKNYWMLIPFSLGASFPVLPLGGRSLEFPELAIAGCSLFFALRVASRKEKLQVFRTVNIPVLLFVAWVGMVFIMNPVGLAMLGSQAGGARFYIKLALAFAAFLIMSSRDYTEKDIRWIFGFLIFGACFSLVYGFAEYAIAGPRVDPTTGLVGDEFYTWHQLLAGPPLTIVFLIFARWKPGDIFSLQRAGLLLIYGLCVAMVLLSGKRMALLAVFLAPLVSAIMYRQTVALIAGLTLAIVAVGGLVAGQGEYFRLPLGVQRTLSWLPGDWDPEFQAMKGGRDDFREDLRRYAMDNIKADPWIGRGFAVNIAETISAVSITTQGDLSTIAMALGRSWHNAWLGYAADFGIPLSIIQGVVYLWILVLSAKVFLHYGNHSLFGVFALYVLIFSVRDLVASHTSGHTALDAWGRWWMYGVIVSIHAGMQAARARVLPRNFAMSKQGIPSGRSQELAHPRHI
jgi:O-Antigen ligase